MSLHISARATSWARSATVFLFFFFCSILWLASRKGILLMIFFSTYPIDDDTGWRCISVPMHSRVAMFVAAHPSKPLAGLRLLDVDMAGDSDWLLQCSFMTPIIGLGVHDLLLPFWRWWSWRSTRRHARQRNMVERYDG